MINLLVIIICVFSMLFPVNTPEVQAMVEENLTKAGIAYITPTPVVTPTPAVTPSPLPTEAQMMSEEEMADLDQQFYDFIKREGEFSANELNNKLLSTRNMTLNLGCVEGDENGVTIQGWFFDYIRLDDYIIMAVGFDGADNKSHIKPLAIPISYFEKENNQTVKFGFSEMGEWKTSTTYHLVWESNAEHIIDRLFKTKGNPIEITLYTNMTEEIIRNGVNFFGEGCESYLREFIQTNELALSLMSEISILKNERILNIDANDYPITGESIPEITNVDDFLNTDVGKVPLVFMIWSNLW